MPDEAQAGARLTSSRSRATTDRPGPAERGLAAAKGGKPGAGQPDRPTASVLVYYESAGKRSSDEEKQAARNARLIAEIYARQMSTTGGASGAVVHGVSTWKEFHAHVGRHRSIGRLVLMLHGADGAMSLSSVVKDLDQIAAAFGAQPPQVGRVDIEACNVANDAPRLARFGRRLGATHVSGWNQFWIPSVTTVQVGDRHDIGKLTALTAPFRRWLLPNSPSDEQMLKRGGRWQLVVEWFRDDYCADPLPGPPPRGEPDTRAWTFRPRSSAVERTIRAEDAGAFVKEMAKPVVPLTHLTIDLTPQAKPAAPSPAAVVPAMP